MFWQRLKNYCNTHLIGVEVKRKDIIAGLQSGQPQQLNVRRTIYGTAITTFDCYMNYLHKAGYLRKPRRGWYTLDVTIPTDLSIEDVKSEAYGIIDYDGNRRVIPQSIRDIADELTRKFGIEAHEKKHEYFSREEFEIAS